MTTTNPPPPETDVALVGLPNGLMASPWAQWLHQFLRWYRVTTTTAKRPTGLKESDSGLEIFDTTLGKPVWWTGSTWIDISGGGGGGGVSSVTGSPPVVSSGGTTPIISMPPASASVNGHLTSADWTAFNGKQANIVAGTTAQYYRGDKTFQTLDKAAVGLANVDNTSDVNKPVSTAQAAADALKEDKANKGVVNGYASLDASAKVPAAQLPAYVDDVVEYANLAAFPATGTTGVIYVALDTNKVYRWTGSAYIEISPSPGSTDAVPEGTTNLYYKGFRALADVTWATITGKPATFPPSAHVHPQSDVTNLVSDLALKAALASPTFTGDPKAPTPTAGDNDTSIATTAFVTAAVAAVGGGGGITDAPSDNGEYVRINAAWRLKSQTFDLSGVSLLTLSVPSWAKAVSFCGMAFCDASGYVALVVSADGTTYFNGASDYINAGANHQTGTSLYQTSGAAANSVILVTAGGNATAFPHTFDGSMGLVRPDTGSVFDCMVYSKMVDNQAAFLHRTLWFHGFPQTTTTTALTLKGIRFANPTSVAWRSGSWLSVRWA
jgi:hypothetical protein